jgi:hypothetical protein
MCNGVNRDTVPAPDIFIVVLFEECYQGGKESKIYFFTFPSCTLLSNFVGSPVVRSSCHCVTKELISRGLEGWTVVRSCFFFIAVLGWCVLRICLLWVLLLIVVERRRGDRNAARFD